ncbi:protease-associated domain-containing protein [Parasphingopyxis marina]|uniref:PA domain-containing protein n=1 Tax=Parasphingopyxis marina TaxID=2761622 RepID=A0A842HUR6_9SPHN|nr:hypothetical protein [Parasphingopyxis marina]MBC2776675.1 hypothetical protein [Parasphingopyxis marina]
MKSQDATRRQFLAGTTALPLIPSTLMPSALKAATGRSTSVADDLARYIGFGNKQSGGEGDNACGAWLEAELESAGFSVERQTLSVPFFDAERSDLVCGEEHAALQPQPIVIPSGPDGITGPLVRVGPEGMSASLAGAIALIDLPSRRWSTALSDAIRRPIETAFARGARAAIVITNGPTGKTIALNTDGREPMFAGPVALLAPEAAAPFLAAATRGDRATMTVTGIGGRRPCFNISGRIDRGRGRWLVVSTPRSGWGSCAGERGGGVAAWLEIARWAGSAATQFDLAFICNSAHEYQYLGAEEMLHAAAPRPEETAFWLHLGANLASRDWHDSVGAMTPLPGTDSQRYLVVSPELLPAAQREFSGLAGLEAPYSSEDLSAGELTNVIEAGYAPVAGIFGIHRFHHIAEDDARCVSAGAVAETSAAFRRLVEHVLATA